MIVSPGEFFLVYGHCEKIYSLPAEADPIPTLDADADADVAADADADVDASAGTNWLA
jgi:hypothetical protein